MSLSTRCLNGILRKRCCRIVVSVRPYNFAMPEIPKVPVRPTGFVVDPYADPHTDNPVPCSLLPDPMIIARRVKGVVKSFDVLRGYGTITRMDDTNQDVFVYQADIEKANPKRNYANLAEGEFVEFSVKRTGEQGVRAVHVTGPDGDYVIGKEYDAFWDLASAKSKSSAKIDVIAHVVPGMVESFSLKLGLGYIKWLDNDASVLVRAADIKLANPLHNQPSLLPNESVEFDLATSEQGLIALNVCGPNDTAVQGFTDRSKEVDLVEMPTIGLRVDLNHPLGLFRPY